MNLRYSLYKHFAGIGVVAAAAANSIKFFIIYVLSQQLQ
jgi:hypothetical protein